MPNVETKAGIASEIKPGGKGAYDPITLRGEDIRARQLIADDTQKALDLVMNEKEPSALQTATGIRLIEKFQSEGDYQRAVEIANTTGERLTKNGQAISAARIMSSLDPQGILVFASRKIQAINDKKWFKLPGMKDAQLTPEVAQELERLAKVMQNAADPEAKLEASQLLQATLNELAPSSIGRKLATTQVTAQLYNPKTQIRNIVGNELFYRLERLNKFVATPIDWARSTLTGSERTVTFDTAGQGGYWKVFLQGAKAGWKGVNP
jgi:hypothetical protein